MSTQTLSVTLPSEIILVTGAVNGVDKTWTRVDNDWQTVADRSEDDVYVLALTATNALGVSAEFNLTLYYGILSLITDRTQADVTGKTAKGYYNASDLNRVGSAVEYIAKRLDSLGYAVSVKPKTDWLETDLPTATELETYRQNVVTLRRAIRVMATTPQPPGSMRYLTYAGANALEQILVDVDALLTLLQQSWVYSGEVYAGEI